MTRLFLDTEFIDCDQISIAISIEAEDGRNFYAERNDFRRSACKDFVQTDVLPFLGRCYPDRVMNKDQRLTELQEWLVQFTQQEHAASSWSGRSPHHALHDARALKYACREAPR